MHERGEVTSDSSAESPFSLFPLEFSELFCTRNISLLTRIPPGDAHEQHRHSSGKRDAYAL